jgi:queuine tRNA-ribosyltransferase
LALDEFEIVTLKSGVKSLRSLAHQETFHPVTGAVAEANALHVAQQRLRERAGAMREKFVIWDVGLGAAGNALAAIEALAGREADVELHSFDKTTAPLKFALAHANDLPDVAARMSLLTELLRTGSTNVSHIRWTLHLGDFHEQIKTGSLEAPGSIFYDPYSHTVNPEMWTLEHFTRVFRRLRADVPCLLTNYTRSTAVRVTMLLSGFFVGRGVAIGEKNETTIASNALELLEKPLGLAWLESVLRSSNSAPLCEAREEAGGKIRAEDFERLRTHSQFRN